MRSLEQFREIYWEAKRAPERCATLNRNPYRREKIIKKIYGKTKEERQTNFNKIEEDMQAHFR